MILFNSPFCSERGDYEGAVNSLTVLDDVYSLENWHRLKCNVNRNLRVCNAKIGLEKEYPFMCFVAPCSIHVVLLNVLHICSFLFCSRIR